MFWERVDKDDTKFMQKKALNIRNSHFVNGVQQDVCETTAGI